MQDFIADLRYRQQKVWREADDLDPRAVNKKVVTYHKWCGKSLKQCAGPPFILPSYLCMELKRKVVRNVSRFRLRAHHLKVESCKWLGGSDVVISVAAMKFKTRSMPFSTVGVLRFVSCARSTRTSFMLCLRLCMLLLILMDQTSYHI